MWKINTGQHDVWLCKFPYEKIFTICEPDIHNYISICFHDITFQVSNNQMLLWNSGTHMEILLCGTYPAEETRVNDMAQTISLLSFPYILLTTKHYKQTKDIANWCNLVSYYSVTFRIVEGTWCSGSCQKHSAPAGAGEWVCFSLGANHSVGKVQPRTLAAAPPRARVLKSLGSAEEPKLSASSSTTKSDSGTQGSGEWLGFTHCCLRSVWCFEPRGSFWISYIDHGFLDQYYKSALCLQLKSTQRKLLNKNLLSLI